MDSHAITRSMSGLIEKFKLHGHNEASDQLNNLYNKFINNLYFENHPQVEIYVSKQY